MPTVVFTPGTRARMYGRAGALRRWAKRTPEQRKAEMARVSEGIREKYRAEARVLFPEATAEQIEAAAERLWYVDNVKRAAKATEVRLAKQAAKRDPWVQS